MPLLEQVFYDGSEHGVFGVNGGLFRLKAPPLFLRSCIEGSGVFTPLPFGSKGIYLSSSIPLCE